MNFLFLPDYNSLRKTGERRFLARICTSLFCQRALRLNNIHISIPEAGLVLTDNRLVQVLTGNPLSHVFRNELFIPVSRTCSIRLKIIYFYYSCASKEYTLFFEITPLLNINFNG